MSAPAFSLVEAVTALIILALISSSVLVVINRCMASAADSALRMQAFEVARDNMETLLSKDSVNEMVEYGSSDKHPEIKWQTTVEMFYEPAAMEQMQMADAWPDVVVGCTGGGSNFAGIAFLSQSE